MAKKKLETPRRAPSGAASAAPASAPGGGQFVAVRETIESIVVAFALAFLIRTFEAEAFIIPTGSMSPALLGQHKDVTCAECGYRYRTTASSEDPEEARRRGIVNVREQEVLAGVCPMCRYVMPLRPDLPQRALDEADMAPKDIEFWRTYPGDRILVNKFGADFHEPERWDVIVFKFPGDGNMNYIKRLVGMPGEKLRVQYGDVFTRPLDGDDSQFQLERKPPDTALAMLQSVHDTDFEAAALYEAGWPLRWAATTPGGWKIDAAVDPDQDPLHVAQRFSVDLPADAPIAWLRYRHQLPEAADWRLAREFRKSKSWDKVAQALGVTREEWLAHIRPELIADFNPYNARIERGQIDAGLAWDIFNDLRSNNWTRLGANWVGDLAVECEFDQVEPRGQLMLDLVEAGVHFRATFDLAKNRVVLTAIDAETGAALDFHATGKATIAGAGHRVRFANVDEQLLVWVDDALVPLDNSTYDREKLTRGGRRQAIPWAGGEGEDQGDLAPVGVGAQGAKASVIRLAVLRDVYYIAADHHGDRREINYDYASPYQATTGPDGQPLAELGHPRDLFADKTAWPRWATRRRVEFEIQPEQLFVLGDNSPESKDCRLWSDGDRVSGYPGGAYLDRRLVIGKALCVFWPHSWGAIPGLSILPGWPNFGDMRMVK